VVRIPHSTPRPSAGSRSAPGFEPRTTTGTSAPRTGWKFTERVYEDTTRERAQRPNRPGAPGNAFPQPLNTAA